MDTELIAHSNRINEMIKNQDWDDATEKELRKIEMYCRKTYLMLAHLELLTDETQVKFLESLNVALVRDQKYVKARDSLGDYSIG